MKPFRIKHLEKKERKKEMLSWGLRKSTLEPGFLVDYLNSIIPWNAELLFGIEFGSEIEMLARGYGRGQAGEDDVS